MNKILNLGCLKADFEDIISKFVLLKAELVYEISTFRVLKGRFVQIISKFWLLAGDISADDTGIMAVEHKKKVKSVS